MVLEGQKKYIEKRKPGLQSEQDHILVRLVKSSSNKSKKARQEIERRLKAGRTVRGISGIFDQKK